MAKITQLTSEPLLIPHTNVTEDYLARILHSAAIDAVREEDGSLHIPDGFETLIWMHADQRRNLLTLISAQNLPPQLKAEADILRELNRLNQKDDLVRFSLEQEVITGRCVIPFHEGLNRRQFLKTLFLFATEFAEATRRLEERYRRLNANYRVRPIIVRKYKPRPFPRSTHYSLRYLKGDSVKRKQLHRTEHEFGSR